MIHQQTLCGIYSQSHGAERYRLNLEAFKFQLIMITELLGWRVAQQTHRLMRFWMQVCEGQIHLFKQVQVIVQGATLLMFWSQSGG